MAAACSSSDGPIYSPFESLPYEITGLILPYLRNPHLQRLSECSKTCAGITFPFRFRSIRLTKRSFEAFRPGGIMGHTLEVIRAVTIFAYDFGECERLSADLSQFTRMTSFSLVLCAGPSICLDNNLHTAILNRLAQHKFYQNIKTLKLEFERYWVPRQAGNYDDELAKMSVEVQEFLGPDEIRIKDPRAILHGIVCPPALKTVSLVLTRNRISDLLNFNDALFLLSLSSYPVTTLKINIVEAYGEGYFWRSNTDYREVYITFPGIRRLKFRGHYFKKRDFPEIGRRFPNLELLDVRIDIMDYRHRSRPRHHQALEDLGPMPRLRELILHWPFASYDDSSNLHSLETVLMGWMEAGLTALNRIQFYGEGLVGEVDINYKRDGQKLKLMAVCTIETYENSRKVFRWSGATPVKQASLDM